MVFRASWHIIILNHHVSMQLIKNPQPVMSMQQIKRWGHDFLSIRGGIFKPLGQRGKSKCQRENPSKLSTTFLVLFTQSFITARNWLSWLLHRMGKVWKPKFEFEKPIVFGKRILTPWASKNPKRLPIPTCFHVFMFSSPFSFTWSSWRQLELPVCVSTPVFCCLPHFSHAGK